MKRFRGGVHPHGEKASGNREIENANKFPLLLCTSVIRSNSRGGAKGGAYIVDLDNRTFKLVIDWND